MYQVVSTRLPAPCLPTGRQAGMERNVLPLEAVQVVQEEALPDVAAEAIEQLVLWMQAEGYRVGAPAPEVATLDTIIVENSKCKRCLQVSLVYVGFYISSPRSYKCFGVCTICGEVREF